MDYFYTIRPMLLDLVYLSVGPLLAVLTDVAIKQFKRSKQEHKCY